MATHSFVTTSNKTKFSSGGRWYSPPSNQVSVNMDENSTFIELVPVTKNLFPATTILSTETVNLNTVPFSGTIAQLYDALVLLFPNANTSSGGTGLILENTNTNTTAGRVGYDQTVNALTIGDGTQVNQINMGVWSTYVPTYTGFSANPTVQAARYCVVGKLCAVHIRLTAGTSNATTFTMTLPFAAANTAQQIFPIVGVDAGTTPTTACSLYTRVNSNIADLYKTLSSTGAGWTASGSKGANFVITYEIA